MQSVETTYFGDGSYTRSSLQDVAYNDRGQRVGTITEVFQGGTMETRIFLLDGQDLGAEAIRDAINEEAESTGESVEEIFWGWFSTGRLAESTVRVTLNKTSEILRTDIQYNDNGQMTHYEDRTSDEPRGLSLIHI